jgi:hypothetical protein
MGAGKVAAAAAVTSRIEPLTGSLHKRAEMVRDPAAAASGASNRCALPRARPRSRHAGLRVACGVAVRGRQAPRSPTSPKTKEKKSPTLKNLMSQRAISPAMASESRRRRRGPSGRLPRLGRPGRGEECPQRTVHRRAGTRVGNSQ